MTIEKFKEFLIEQEIIEPELTAQDIIEEIENE